MTKEISQARIPLLTNWVTKESEKKEDCRGVEITGQGTPEMEEYVHV